MTLYPWNARFLVIAAVLAMGPLVAPAAAAKTIAIDLATIIRDSDLVVEGHVLRELPTTAKGPWGLPGAVYEVHVDATYKGLYRPENVNVLMFPHFEDSGALKLGYHMMFFLEECGRTYEPLLGYKGALLIEKKTIWPWVLRGEPYAQSFAQFKARVVALSETSVHAKPPRQDVCMSMWKYE